MKTLCKMQQSLRNVAIQTNVETTGDPNWTRMFLVYNGISIGRINFHNDKPTNLKIYSGSSGVGVNTAREIFNYQAEIDTLTTKIEHRKTAYDQMHSEFTDLNKDNVYMMSRIERMYGGLRGRINSMFDMLEK